LAIAERIRGLIGQDLATMRGRPFQVVRVTDSTVVYRANGSDRQGQTKNYNAVLDHLDSGNQIGGPRDIQRLCPGDRNAAYEWAVLRQLGILR